MKLARYAVAIVGLLMPSIACAQSLQGGAQPQAPIQGGTVGSAPVAGANNVQVVGKDLSGNLILQSFDACQTQPHTFTPINIATSIVKVIATGVSAKKIYVSHLFLFAGAADNVGVFEATTGTTCATSPVAVIGAATTVATAATGLVLAANQGFVEGSGVAAILATSVNNNDLCLATSAAVQLSGFIVWTTQ
jgi:hypothetical protein